MFARVLIINLLVAIAVAGATGRASSQIQTNATDIPPDAAITLNREGLIVTILADGRVLVEGQTFDFDISAIKSSLTREQVRSLISGFEQIGFFWLKDQYRDEADGCSSDGRVREVPIMQMTSLIMNGRSKSVTRYPAECLEPDGSPYPRSLVRLEQQVETVLNLHKR
ncbi:MAG TPA: hypothetical protein VE961_23850 [Pyrinomonadaceae bacterium]|nr:hypothetical protein [Pyrinomonadaceae bacterium]